MFNNLIARGESGWKRIVTATSSNHKGNRDCNTPADSTYFCIYGTEVELCTSEIGHQPAHLMPWANQHGKKFWVGQIEGNQKISKPLKNPFLIFYFEKIISIKQHLNSISKKGILWVCFQVHDEATVLPWLALDFFASLSIVSGCEDLLGVHDRAYIVSILLLTCLFSTCRDSTRIRRWACCGRLGWV